MKIIVTGAAGFIGSHLAEALTKKGHDVVGIDNFSGYYPVELKEENAELLRRLGVKMVRTDLAQDDVAPYIQVADVIYHLAAQPGLSSHVSLETYVRNNVTATERLLSAVRKNSSPPLFVNISTSSVYGAEAMGDEKNVPSPISYYGITKLAAERLALMFFRQYGPPVVSLRIFSVYGERERPDKLFPKLITSLFTDTPVALFEGSEEHRRSFTYVGDIVEGLLAVLDKRNECVGEVLNLGNPQSIRTGEAIKIIERLTGRKVQRKYMPPRPGDQQETMAVTKKAERLLSFCPSTPFQEGISREIEWLKKG